MHERLAHEHDRATSSPVVSCRIILLPHFCNMISTPTYAYTLLTPQNGMHGTSQAHGTPVSPLHGTWPLLHVASAPPALFTLPLYRFTRTRLLHLHGIAASRKEGEPKRVGRGERLQPLNVALQDRLLLCLCLGISVTQPPVMETKRGRLV